MKQRVTGIIAEYNPFHKGHAYHIARAKELTGADCAVILMSPNFVQRGEPALFDKYVRCEMALRNGADCVLELPTPFATGGARTFAEASIALLDKSNLVDSIVFGSECGELPPLSSLAEVLAEEPADFSQALQEGLRQGMTYPHAISRAWALCFPGGNASLLQEPNNLLGIEYLIALKKRASRIRPYTLRREGSYLSAALPSTDQTRTRSASSDFFSCSEGSFASALSLRQAIYSGLAPETLFPFIPDNLSDLFSSPYVSPEELSPLLHQRLLSGERYHLPPFEEYEDLSAELAGRIRHNLSAWSSYGHFLEQLKTATYTRARIARGLLHLLLEIRKSDMRRYQAADYGSYLRILGFRDSFLPCLRKYSGDLTLVTRPAQDISSLDEISLSIFSAECYASELYCLLQTAKDGIPRRNENGRRLIRLP